MGVVEVDICDIAEKGEKGKRNKIERSQQCRAMDAVRQEEIGVFSSQ